MHIHVVNGVAIIRDGDDAVVYRDTLAAFGQDADSLSLPVPHIPAGVKEILVDPTADTSGRTRYAITAAGDQVAVPDAWLSYAGQVLAKLTDLQAAYEARQPDPEPVPEPNPRLLSPRAFRDLLTDPEIDAIVAEAQSNAQVLGLLFRVSTADVVDMDSTRLQAGLDAVRDLGLITAARRDEIDNLTKPGGTV